VSSLEPGAIFGRDFRIVKALRAGGMGAVYIADQLSTGKQRALKVMAPELATDPSIRERFVLEARAASSIESDHVVEIVTAGVDEETGAPFLVMELLKGEELADALARVGPLPLGDVAEVLSQIGHALELAHLQGIVHRDLKLENIFLASSRRRDASFTAKILDFGIAKLVEEGRQKTGTQPLGTPLFMAPEQTDRKGRICPATDVWALGLIGFRLLTGRDFWAEADGSLTGLLREICIDPLPFASVRAHELAALPLSAGQFSVPPLPPGFDAWFARCVTRDIDARFQNAGDAVRAFSELVTVDAPRGALGTGMIGDPSTVSGALPSQATLPTRPVQIRPAGAATADVQAQTGAVTAGSMVQTAPAPASSSKAWMAVAAVGVALGGYGAYRLVGGSAPTPMPVSTVVAASSAAPVTSSAAPVGAAAPAGTCPPSMITIPMGKMFMGARDLTPDTRPPHEVTVSRFCMDRTEVTTSAYLACVEKGECERPPDKVSFPGVTPDQVKRFSPLCNAGHPERGEHPINCVAWTMADTFCKKRGARLPTEAEWEYSARGTEQRKYPWGNQEPGSKYLNACGKECAKWGQANGDKHASAMYDEDDGFPGTAPVGSFPAGASVFGVVDLAGNVWEWTADWHAPYGADAVADPKGPATGTQRVARGGDFTGLQPDWARPAFRWKTDPEVFNHALGFRCAADPK
jgi:formylglycine-generating enzyme required for sulfatase activity/tRNA A-37 threonylcarbamoyl transferase component Bud32